MEKNKVAAANVILVALLASIPALAQVAPSKPAGKEVSKVTAPKVWTPNMRVEAAKRADEALLRAGFEGTMEAVDSEFPTCYDENDPNHIGIHCSDEEIENMPACTLKPIQPCHNYDALRYTFALAGRVFALKFQDSSPWKAWGTAGFREVVLTDGFNSTWVWTCHKPGQPLKENQVAEFVCAKQ